MRARTIFATSRLRLGCGLLALILCIGTVGFWLIEGWSPHDALFVSFLIVSTLGFADLRPSGMPGQALAIMIVMAGVGALSYIAGTLAQLVIEDGMYRGGRRRMDQQIARLRDHYIVCGFGRVGREICRQLTQERRPFLVIDNEPERIARIQAQGYLYLQGDASDDGVLRSAGIERARGLLTAVQSDAANVYITLSARALNAKLLIVARAATAEAEHKLTIAGATRVMSPYVLGGRSMAGMMLRPAVADFLDLLAHSDDLGMWLENIVVRPGSALAGATIASSRLRETFSVAVLAVRSAPGVVRVNPPADTLLQPGDTLIVLGSRETLEQVARVY